jgi:hypothetical protein
MKANQIFVHKGKLMLRLFKPALILAMLGLLIVACTNAAPESPKTEFEEPLSNRADEVHKEGEVHRHINPDEADEQIQLVLVPSELIVGHNRFAVGIFDQGGDLVHDANVHLHFYDLGDPSNPFFEMEANAYPLSTDQGDVTIFAYDREFSHGGLWGVEVEVTFPDGTEAINGIRFSVADGSPSIEPGEVVPEVQTPTIQDVNQNLSLLSSAETPNPAFYQLSLDQAVTSGKPTMLLFATPSYCQTRFCGPSYDRGMMNFIHVEVFTGLPNPESNDWAVSPAMEQFGLESEPWIFLIDQDGTVLYRVEGLFTREEIEQNVKEHLGF